jgi:G3E family GTPase
LIERSSAAEQPFDYILLETTGLADPGNIAPIFWMDEGLGSSIYLDGIVTVVDAKNVFRTLDEPTAEEEADAHEDGVLQGHGHKASPIMTTAHLQISHADIILLNKTDLVSPPELDAITSRLRSINGLAKLIPTTHSHVPQLEGVVLDLHAYDALSTIPDFEGKGHSHLDPNISTRSFKIPVLPSAGLGRLEVWLRRVLWREGNEGDDMSAEVHRVKGVLPMEDGSVKVLQGVREIFDIIDTDTRGGHEGVKIDGGKIVMIGRRLENIDKPSLLD